MNKTEIYAANADLKWSEKCIIIFVPITMCHFPSSMLPLPQTNAFILGSTATLIESPREYVASALEIFDYYSSCGLWALKLGKVSYSSEARAHHNTHSWLADIQNYFRI